MPTLAELRASKPSARPERSLSLCLAGDVVAKVQELTEALANLPEEPQRQRRQGEAAVVSEQESLIREQLEAALRELRDAEGVLTLRANLSDGEWRRWCDQNAPRAEGKPGHERDRRYAGGVCNADALIDNLGAFAHEWNGEPLSGSDWVEVFEPVVSHGDKIEAARAVVAMYESRLDFQKLRTRLSDALAQSDTSSSPEPSESPASD